MLNKKKLMITDYNSFNKIYNKNNVNESTISIDELKLISITEEISFYKTGKEYTYLKSMTNENLKEYIDVLAENGIHLEYNIYNDSFSVSNPTYDLRPIDCRNNILSVKENNYFDNDTEEYYFIKNLNEADSIEFNKECSENNISIEYIKEDDEYAVIKK